MARYLILAMNGPTDGEGDDETLARWYDQVHIPDFKAIPEVKTARRYKILRGNVPGVEEMWPYVSAYEIETDDMAAVSAQLQKMRPFDPTLDRSKSANIMAVQIAGDD
jgi:hypothetical protein